MRSRADGRPPVTACGAPIRLDGTSAPPGSSGASVTDAGVARSRGRTRTSRGTAMKLFHQSGPDRPPTPDASGPAGTQRLAGVRPLCHDDDDRPSREDRGAGETIFTGPPVPVPRVLTGRRRRRTG